MTEDTYNGWTNRETWAVALHIDSDPLWQAYRGRLCYEAADLAGTDPKYQLAETLKTWITDVHDDFYSSEPGTGNRADPNVRAMLADIGSLWRVNWTEIAENALLDFHQIA